MTVPYRDFHAHLSGVVVYRVPDLVGLTVAQAVEEWENRYGGDRTERVQSWRASYQEAITISQTMVGFTGGISPSDAPGDAIVTSYTTVPASVPGDWMEPATALLLDFTAYLVTPGGDQLTTPSGDLLTT